MTVLYPSIDLRGGHVVRLRRGDYAVETVYGDDPVGVATSFADQGATWIHVVDLDAGAHRRVGQLRSHRGDRRRHDGRATVQAGGGVRSVAAPRRSPPPEWVVS